MTPLATLAGVTRYTLAPPADSRSATLSNSAASSGSGGPGTTTLRSAWIRK